MQKVRNVDIKFGYSCNNNCIHCVIAGHRERLRKEGKPIDRTTEEIKKHLLEAKEKGAESVVFTGGEVTIRKDFFELLEFATNLGLKVSLQTNGRAFYNKAFAEKTLKTAQDMHFEIAIHSSIEKNHDRITRVKGSWKQTMQGIKNLLEAGAKSLNFKVVISRLNYKDLSEIVELAKGFGVKQVDIAFPHGMGNALKYWYEIIPRYSEIKEYILEAAKVSKESGVKVTFEAIPFCLLRGYEDCVSETTFLEEFLEGETTELRQVGDPVMNWQKERLSIKAKAPQCKDCKYFFVCEGVWREYIELYGDREFEPIRGEIVKSLSILKG